MNPIFEKFVPSEFDDIIFRLEEWAVQNNVVSLARTSCQHRLDEYLEKGLKGNKYVSEEDIKSVHIEFHQHSLVFQHRGLVCPHILTELSLCMRNQVDKENTENVVNRIIGIYRYAIRLDNLFSTDFLKFYDIEQA